MPMVRVPNGGTQAICPNVCDWVMISDTILSGNGTVVTWSGSYDFVIWNVQGYNTLTCNRINSFAGFKSGASPVFLTGSRTSVDISNYDYIAFYFSPVAQPMPTISK